MIDLTGARERAAVEAADGEEDKGGEETAW